LVVTEITANSITTCVSCEQAELIAYRANQRRKTKHLPQIQTKRKTRDYLVKETYYEHTELYRSIEFACCSNNTWQNAMNKGTLALQLFQTKCSSMNSNTTRTYGSRVKQCRKHVAVIKAELLPDTTSAGHEPPPRQLYTGQWLAVRVTLSGYAGHFHLSILYFITSGLPK
jgi:hypothetical protein